MVDGLQVFVATQVWLTGRQSSKFDLASFISSNVFVRHIVLSTSRLTPQILFIMDKKALYYTPVGPYWMDFFADWGNSIQVI